MSKYNEVMDNLVVTEEMRKRLLANVEKEMSQAEASEKMPETSDSKVSPDGNEVDDKKPESSQAETTGDDKASKNGSRRARIIEFRRYAGIAAAFCVLVVGAYAVSRVVPFGNSSNMSATSSYDAAEAPMAYEAEYATETAATEEAYEEIEEAADEYVGLMTAGPEITEDAASDAEAFGAEENAMVDSAAPSAQVAIKEAEATGKTSNASMANSKFSIFKIFGKNGGEKSTQIKEYASLQKLSTAALTEFKEIDYFDSFSSDKEYHLYDGKVALIYYDVAGNDVVVKEMSTKKGASIPYEVSGVTADMGSTSSVSVGDVSVTLKGCDDTYSIATWTQNGLVYELESSELLTYEDMKELMEEIVK